MAEQKEYLEQLKAWKDEQVIKVVTGIRRCGKSTLLSQYQQLLQTTGITDEQIVSVNFEELEYEELLDYRKLYSYLKERLCAEKTTYKNLPCVGRHRGQREILWAYCKGSAQR
ncbi:MAG: AAA family ATPase [Butyricicoccaceae bacterium]